MNNEDFVGLLANAKGCVVSAGDTLLQCFALHKPCVAAPVSPDQPARLKRCQAKQLLLVAQATPESIAKQAIKLTQQDNQASSLLINNTKLQAPSKALDTIVNDVTSLFSTEKEHLTTNKTEQDKN